MSHHLPGHCVDVPPGRLTSDDYLTVRFGEVKLIGKARQPRRPKVRVRRRR